MSDNKETRERWRDVEIAKSELAEYVAKLAIDRNLTAAELFDALASVMHSWAARLVREERK